MIPRNTLKGLSFLLISSLSLLQVSSVLAIGEILTSTDTTSPIISNVMVISVSSVAENISWTTDEPAVSTFKYGITQSYGKKANLPSDLAVGGSVSLTELEPSTKYYYCITSTDNSGNSAKYCGYSFTTAAAAELAPASTPAPDTTPPVITESSDVSIGLTGASVAWATDEPAYGYLEYGATESYSFSTPKSASATLDHSAEITGLEPGTTYHYRIVAEDESGNIGYSNDKIFTTEAEMIPIDNMPPEITGVSATEITMSQATISWTTNELAQGKVEYGKTIAYGKSSDFSVDYVTEHSQILSSLESDTEYHYKIIAEDESGNQSISPDEVFITDSVPETQTTEESANLESEPSPTPPPSLDLKISHIETQTVSETSATIIWNTNVPATSQVFYGKTQTYNLSSPVSENLVTAHSITITGLTSGTNYFYKVVSQDASDKIVSKAGFEFNKLYKQKPVVVAPVISNISITQIGESSVTILFITNIMATGKINYGTTTGYEETDGGHLVLLTNHTHPLKGLSPNTTYNFQIAVQDTLGNETIYKNLTFKTLAAQVSAPVTPGSNNSSAGSFYYTPSGERAVPKPVITKVDGLNGEVLFLWKPASKESGLKTIIVKQDNSYSKSLFTGDVIYQGNSGQFVDTNLNNDTAYHYSVFRVNRKGHYSFAMNFNVVPKKDNSQTKIVATPQIVQKTPIYTFSETLFKGDAKKEVSHLQALLALEPSIYPEGMITGYFGPLTEGAIKKFQTKYSIAPTGIANNQTLRKLEKVSSIEVVKNKATVFDKALYRDLRAGLIGGDVAILQQFLINAGVFPEARVTGYFGELTKTALQKFQQEQNISPAVGYFGSTTKKRMLNLIRLKEIS